MNFADGQIHVGDTKSRAAERTMTVPAFVLQALRRHPARQDRRRLKIGEAWQDLDLVVDRGDGVLYSPPSFSKAWERFAARSGFAGVKFHGLRHGAATLMLAAGISDAVAMRLMGHTSVKDARPIRGPRGRPAARRARPDGVGAGAGNFRSVR